jgi:fructokinase
MSFKIVGIGEVLWDLLPSGSQLGGAPANFAYHAHALGADVRVVTRVGEDDFGQAILRRFHALDILDGTVQVDVHVPTGTVTVTLGEHGIPSYFIHENVAWDRLEVTPAALNAVREADAICFGTLAQRGVLSRNSIQRLVAASPVESLRVFDINLRQKYFSTDVVEMSLRLANVLKLNDDELPVLAQMFHLPGSPRQQIELLAKKFGLRLIALTRGPAGSLLFRAGKWSDCPSVPIQIVDTVGAGDAFTATLVMGLLQNLALDEINCLADEVARYVCSCAGATPPLPERFSRRFSGDHNAVHQRPSALASKTPEFSKS